MGYQLQVSKERMLEYMEYHADNDEARLVGTCDDYDFENDEPTLFQDDCFEYDNVEDFPF